jgi:hypothetical protein
MMVLEEIVAVELEVQQEGMAATISMVAIILVEVDWVGLQV